MRIGLLFFFDKFRELIPFKKNYIKLDNFPKIKNIINEASSLYKKY